MQYLRIISSCTSQCTVHCTVQYSTVLTTILWYILKATLFRWIYRWGLSLSCWSRRTTTTWTPTRSVGPSPPSCPTRWVNLRTDIPSFLKDIFLKWYVLQGLFCEASYWLRYIVYMFWYFLQCRGNALFYIPCVNNSCSIRKILLRHILCII